MGHGKETPRQKLIGMMYLVLMAMLALNVSSDVLNAFSVLDEGLGKTKHSIDQTNEVILHTFEEQNKINPQKVSKWLDKAKDVTHKAEEINGFIEKCKRDIMVTAGEDTTVLIDHGHIHLAHMKAKDKTDAPAIVMVGDANDKAGAELKKMLGEYKEFLLHDILSTAHEHTKHTIEEGLSTADAESHGEVVDWSIARFTHMPQVGVIAILTGIQINVKNAEAEALKHLYAKIDEGTFKFTNLDATVIPNSSYIIKGNEYKAEVFIAARDSTAIPVIYVTESPNPYDSSLVEGEEGVWEYKKRAGVKYTKIVADKSTGKANYSMPGSSIGSKNWGGIIELIGPTGDTIFRPFKKSYMVAEGAVTVAPTKMNVFYVGVDNPVDVSVAGVKPEDIDVQITNGKIKKQKGGSYIVNPRRPGNSYITVFANIEGKKSSMGKKEFRVKRVPDPVAKVNDKKGGGIAKTSLLASGGVAADLENFDFDLKFRVTQFTVSATVQGFRKDAKSRNYKFTDAQKQIIKSLNKGQKVYIEDIKAVGPDGSTRDLPTIALLLN